jgi:N-methylhydantoinase A/oxoprolinase/acetone carboxylase beta subunit
MAAVFSAYGIGECDVSQHYALTIHDCDAKKLKNGIASLKIKAARDMFAEGFEAGSYDLRARVVATLGGKEVGYEMDAEAPTLPEAFKQVDLVELELSAVKSMRTESLQRAKFATGGSTAVADGKRTILIKGLGRVDVPVYRLADLSAGDHGVGPAIIEEDFFTCRVLDGWSFVISDAGDILLKRKG